MLSHTARTNFYCKGSLAFRVYEAPPEPPLHEPRRSHPYMHVNRLASWCCLCQQVQTVQEYTHLLQFFDSSLEWLRMCSGAMIYGTCILEEGGIELQWIHWVWVSLGKQGGEEWCKGQACNSTKSELVLAIYWNNILNGLYLMCRNRSICAYCHCPSPWQKGLSVCFVVLLINRISRNAHTG